MIPLLTQCNTYHHLSLSTIKIEKERNLHDSLINTVQQLHHHSSVSIIKVQSR